MAVFIVIKDAEGKVVKTLHRSEIKDLTPDYKNEPQGTLCYYSQGQLSTMKVADHDDVFRQMTNRPRKEK